MYCVNETDDMSGTQQSKFARLLNFNQAAFTEKLSMAIKYCGLDSSRYKGHTFRIGAASHAADEGMSDAQIRALGRWKSNAFQKYIRIPSISS